MRAGRTRQHPVNVPLCNTNVRQTKLVAFSQLQAINTNSGYDRIKEDQAGVPRPPSGEGGEVALSHVTHSTGNTKRPNTAA